MKIDLTPEQIAAVVEMMRASGQAAHEHCWHPWQGPIHMVLQDGHVLMKCCKCPSTETRHSAHIHMAVHS